MTNPHKLCIILATVFVLSSCVGTPAEPSTKAASNPAPKRVIAGVYEGHGTLCSVGLCTFNEYTLTLDSTGNAVQFLIAGVIGKTFDTINQKIVLSHFESDSLYFESASIAGELYYAAHLSHDTLLGTLHDHLTSGGTTVAVRR